MGIQLIIWNDEESRYDNVDMTDNVYGAIFILKNGREIRITHTTQQDHADGGVVIQSIYGALRIAPKVANTIVVEVM